MTASREPWHAVLWHMPGRLAAAMLKAAPPSFWAQTGAAIAMTLVFIGFGLVIWKGPWPASLARVQLDLLGQGMLLSGGLVLVALVCIMGLKLAVNAGKDGLRANVERDDDPPPPAVVTTTTTTAVSPPPAP